MKRTTMLVLSRGQSETKFKLEFVPDSLVIPFMAQKGVLYSNTEQGLPHSVEQGLLSCVSLVLVPIYCNKETSLMRVEVDTGL